MEGRIKMTTHRGMSGKFIATPPTLAQDIIRIARHLPNGCIVAPSPLPYGYFRSGIWMVKGKSTLRGNSKAHAKQGTLGYTKAANILYEARYPKNFTHFHSTYGIKRICSTPGCINPLHHTLYNSNLKKNAGEAYMSQHQIQQLFEKILTEDEQVTFSDEAQADAFRLHLYKTRRKWKKDHPELWMKYEDIMISKNKIHPNILELSLRSRAWQGVFEQVLGPHQNAQASPIEPESFLTEEELEQVYESEADKAMKLLEGAEKADRVYAELGYAPKNRHPNAQVPQDQSSNSQRDGSSPANAMTYDDIYLRATRGETLTREEIDILEAGPEPEPEPPD